MPARYRSLLRDAMWLRPLRVVDVHRALQVDTGCVHDLVIVGTGRHLTARALDDGVLTARLLAATVRDVLVGGHG